MALEPVGNIAFGENEDVARNSHHAFIWAATGGRRQFFRQVGDVNTDHGEVATGQFPNIRATPATNGLSAISVRVCSDASDENICAVLHAFLVPIGTYRVKLLLVYFLCVVQNRPEIIGSSVARLLRKKREALGLSMNVVATHAGLSHTMVSRVERELRKPTLDTLLRITGAMGIELWPLIKKSEAAEKTAKAKRPRTPR